MLEHWHVVVSIVHILVLVFDDYQLAWFLHWCVELRSKPADGGQEKMPVAAVGLGRLPNHVNRDWSTVGWISESTRSCQGDRP